MKSFALRIVSGGIVIVVLCYVATLIGHAQTSNRAAQDSTGQRQSSDSQMDAEREQLWNSPEMLRARAWLQDYCSKSAKVTPEMAKHYQYELEHMSVGQLKLWLLKFEHEESQRQQQYSLWQQAHSAGLSRAIAANRATQQSYAAINREESEAATQEQGRLNEQQEFAQQESETKQLEAVGPYPYAYPGYGGTHYHFHLYPYPY
jgi:hypothetical protein